MIIIMVREKKNITKQSIIEIMNNIYPVNLFCTEGHLQLEIMCYPSHLSYHQIYPAHLKDNMAMSDIILKQSWTDLVFFTFDKRKKQFITINSICDLNNVQGA